MNIPASYSVTDQEKCQGPAHIAVIMDGNGRWAKERGLPRAEGHRRGAKAVRSAIKGAVDNGLDFLTVYAFSTENWNRSSEEVSDLMGLLRHYLKNEVKSLHKEGIRLKVIGDKAGLDQDIQTLIKQSEEKTADNERLTLSIALNYGGRHELVHAMKELALDIQKGTLSPDDISQATISDRLYTKNIPDPDLVIRTSGEHRISNFLLWQIAYSELLFLDVYWPDFTEDHVKMAVENYKARQRRFGGRPDDASVTG